MTTQEADHWIAGGVRRSPSAKVLRVLSAGLPERVCGELLAHCDIGPDIRGAHLSKRQRQALCLGLTNLELPVTRDRGWDFAEVTAGGVPLNEIDYRTMESRRCPNLYLVGEMLDCDGRIGGFNFHWAWATGQLAGRDCGRRLTSPELA